MIARPVGPLAVVPGIVALVACVDHAPLRPLAPRGARLAVVAAAVEPGDHVVVGLSYLRSGDVAVPITAQSFPLTEGGEHQLTVDVNLSECLRDPLRVADQPGTETCAIVADVILRSAGSVTRDSSRFGPVTVRAGETVAQVVNLFTVPLTVTGATPDPSGGTIAIGDTLRLVFSEPLDAGTVTASTVSLTQGGAPVAVSRTVSSNVLSIVPAALLTEFNTAYVLTLTRELRSAAGNRLASGEQRTYTTEFWSPRYYYRMTNDLLGPGQALETDVGTSQAAFMAPAADRPGQLWFFLLIPPSQHYTMQNADGGDTSGVEGAVPPSPILMFGGFVPGGFSGMMWLPVPAAPGRFYMRNLNFQDARSLDTPLELGVPVPRMELTANSPGQHWTFQRLSQRQ